MIGFSTVQSAGFCDMQAVSRSLADAALTDNARQLRRVAAGMPTHVRGIQHELAEHCRSGRTLPPIVASPTGVQRALYLLVADTRHPSLEFEELRGHDTAALDRFNHGDRSILRVTAELDPFALDRLGPHGPYDSLR